MVDAAQNISSSLASKAEAGKEKAGELYEQGKEKAGELYEQVRRPFYFFVWLMLIILIRAKRRLAIYTSKARRRPATTHRKLVSCTGKERRRLVTTHRRLESYMSKERRRLASSTSKERA